MKEANKTKVFKKSWEIWEDFKKSLMDFQVKLRGP